MTSKIWLQNCQKVYAAIIEKEGKNTKYWKFNSSLTSFEWTSVIFYSFLLLLCVKLVASVWSFQNVLNDFFKGFFYFWNQKKMTKTILFVMKLSPNRIWEIVSMWQKFQVIWSNISQVVEKMRFPFFISPHGMYVYMWICGYVYVYVSMCICVYAYLCICLYVLMWICVVVYVCICLCA